MDETKRFSDRQFEAVLERLDRLCDEVETMNRRLELPVGEALRVFHADGF